MRFLPGWMNKCVPGMEWIFRHAGNNWLRYFFPLKKSMTRPRPLSLPENASLKSAVLFFPLCRYKDITRSSDLSCIRRRKFPHFPGISGQFTTGYFNALKFPVFYIIHTLY